MEPPKKCMSADRGPAGPEQGALGWDPAMLAPGSKPSTWAQV